MKSKNKLKHKCQYKIYWYWPNINQNIYQILINVKNLLRNIRKLILLWSYNNIIYKWKKGAVQFDAAPATVAAGGGVGDELLFDGPCCWLGSGGGATIGIAKLTRLGGGCCCVCCWGW